MLHKWNRFLSILLAIALVTTTFGSDFASAKVYAGEEIEAEEPSEYGLADLSFAEEVPESNEETASEVTEVTEETENIEEDAADTATTGEAQEEIIEEVTSEEENLSDEATDSATAETTETEEEVVAEVLEVTIKYVADKGGEVSKSKETIDVNDPNAAFEGATATAYSNYTFAGWYNEAGEQVTPDATFVPSDVKENATFTAKFVADENIEDLMPAIKVEDQVVGDFTVNIDAEVGVFPAGTTVEMYQIEDSLAVEMAEAAIDNEKEKQAKGIDITFKDEKGNEVQPNNSKYVHISLHLNETIEGDSFTVLHEHKGDVNAIKADVDTADANSNPNDNTQVVTDVAVDVNQFSIIIVVGQNEDDPDNNEYEIGTIKFFSETVDKATDEDVIFEKLVKNGDEIANPGVPHIGENQEFLGWFVDGDSEGTEIVFTNDVYEVSDITHDCVIKVYPVMSSTYYVTFIGSDGEIARVERVPVVKPEDAILDVTDSKFDIPAGAGEAFKGWSREKKTQYTDDDLITKEDPINVVEAAEDGDIFLYAVIVPAFWVRFINNVGGEKGATFTDSQFLEEGDKLGKVLDKVPEAQMPTRTGYEFLGWSLSDDDDREPLSVTEQNTLIQNVSTLDTEKNELKLYACWSPNATTKYTVVEWHQNSTLDGWDYYSSKELEGTTDAEIVFYEGQYEGHEIIAVYTDNDDDEEWWYQRENPQRTVSGKAVQEYISDSEDTDDRYIQAGFEYNTQLESEVKIENATVRDGKYYVNASGNTIVNIYEVRREITVDFQYYGQGGYTYTPTTSNNGTQYGLVNGEYVQLTRYYYYGDYYWYYGNYNWYYGTRYTRSGGSSSWQTYTRNGQFPGQFTGRYGQKFTEADLSYVWPSERTWREQKSGNSASGTTTTFLDTFQVNRTCYSSSDSGSGFTIRHYKQDINGNYTLTNAGAANTTTTSSAGYQGMTFYFTNKYNGFSVARYNENLNNNPNTWSQCRDPEDTDRQGVTQGTFYGSTLYVLHERNQYSVTFKIIDGNGDVIETKVIDGIYYEKPLNTVKAVTDYRDKSREIAGYSFNWYKLPQGDPEGEVGSKDPEKLFDFSTTMPDGGIVIYGVYEPVKYRVTLDADGGTFVNDLAWMQDKPAADRYFNVKSTEEVGRNTLINGVEKNGFELIGWYYVNADGSTGAKFEYGKVSGPVTLRAVWRNQGTVRVWYDTDASKGQYQDGSISYIPDYNYATNSSVVLAAPPTGKRTENGGYSFIGWKVVGDKSETIYLPNGVFTIDNDIYAAGVDKEIEVVIDGETTTETYHCVHVIAQYVETGASGGPDELVDIKYDPNGGHLRSGVSETLTNGQVVVSGLKVNQKIVAKGAIFEKDGYVQVGWNTDPNNSSQGQYVELGQEWIAGDKASKTLNTDINTLYAVYEPLKLYVVIEGTERTETYSGQAYTDNGYSIKEKYYYEGNDKVHGAKVTVSDSVFNKDDIVYTGPSISETDVNRDADENVIAYTETLAIGDFAKASDVTYTVEFSVDTNNELKLTINPATVTVTTGSAEKEYDGTALTNATASATGFVNGESATVTATGTQTEVGSSTNGYQWNEQNIGILLRNYTLEENLGTLRVKENEQTEIIITAASARRTYDGTALTAPTATASGLPAGFTVEASASGSQTDAGTSYNVVDNGYVIKNAAGEDKTANFKNVKTENGTLTVEKAEYRVTTLSAAKPYDGTALTKKDGATITGLVNNETATVVPNGTITEVGTTPNTYDITWGTAKASNYKLAEDGETLGTLTVSQAEITLRADSANKYYDGTPLTANRIVVGGNEKLPEGYKIVGTCDGTITNAGEIANKIESWDIVDAEGNSKKAQFKLVETIDGTLTVKKVTVTIKTGSAVKAYDGTALTNDEASITGLVNNEDSVVKVTATGSQTDVGNSDNTYSIDWGTASADNYEIKEKLGTLEVTKNAAAIILTAASDSKTYDGSALTNAGVTATGLPEGITTDATASGSQTDAGSNDNVVLSGYKFYKGTEDVTDNFTNVSFKNGTLTVNKAKATITTGSGSKPYDGTALTVATASISGLVNNESATVTATGSQTEVGTSDNTYDIVWNKGKADNYDIEENLGKLTITENSAEVKLTAASKSKTYDGTALSDSTVTASGLPEGFTVEATASGSRTDVGESNNVVNDGYVIKNAEGEDKTSSFTNVKKVDGKLTVSKAVVTITTGSDSKEYDGTPLTKDEASITGLKNNETATVTATGTITEVGTDSNYYSIEWGTASADNYEIKEELGTLVITAHTTEVKLTAPSDSKTYDGTALTADGTGDKKVIATGLPEGFTVEATASGSQTNAGTNANVVDDGYLIKNAAGEDKTSNFTNVTKADGTLTVEKAKVTVTTGTDSKAYDGKPLTNDEANITGLVNGETATVKATGTITEVGHTTNTYEITWKSANQDNYTVETSLGTLTITANAGVVTLTAATKTKTYDGQPLTDSTVTASGLPEGFTVEATASGSRTNVGESLNIVNDGYVIRNAAGEDKTSSFTNVSKVNGKLTVDPKEVTITTGGGSKEYDGTPLTNAEAGITGLENNETATVTATGSQTEVGKSDNTYSIDWGTTNKDNYKVIEELGELDVTENTTTKITLTAASGEKTYDGKALTDSTVTVTGLPEGFTYEATAKGSQTNAGESENVVNNGYKFYDAAGNDKTSNFKTVEKENGTLKVNKAPVTITTGSDSKEYDGTPLKNSEAGITGLVNNETATVTATGSQTEVGESKNTYSITWGTAKADNYEITDELGILEVTTNSSAVILTAASREKKYDGEALTDNTVTVTGLPTGFTYEATASGSQTDAGSSDNVVDDGYKFFDEAGKDQTKNFTDVSKENGTLKVTKAPVTITTGSDRKAYDGTALTNAEAKIEATGTPSDAVKNQIATVVVTATGAQTEVGSSNNKYTIDWANVDKNNYDVTDSLGTLEVYANATTVTLTAASGSKTYDGLALTKNEVSVEGLPAGIKARATATGTQTDVGSSDNTVTFYEFYVVETKETVPAGYFTNVQTKVGTLRVDKASVIVKTGTGSKEYDGTALTNDEADIEGLVNNETAIVTATGSQTEVGTSNNTYSITWLTANKDNYEVTDELGSLTVTEHNSPVTLTAASDSKTYDGSALTNSGVTAKGLPEGFTFEATASGSQTDAGEAENVVNDGYVIRNAAREDKTANFTNVNKVSGTLKVEKAPVTVTTGSDSKQYDGKALTKDEAKIEAADTASADVKAQIATVKIKATGSVTEIEDSPTSNTYEITDWGQANADNYEITESLGTLIITKNGGTVTLIAASDSKTYDGTELTAEDVTVTGLPEGFTYEATASGSQTDAGESENVVNDGYKFYDAAGNDKTANFTEVEKVTGTLKVTAVEVKIATESDKKPYDGTALTNEGATIEALGDVSDAVKTQLESVVIVATGSQTEVGTSSNPYEITSWGQATAGNYEIKNENVSLGTLEVTNNNAEVTLTAASDKKVYDGKALTNDEVTPNGLPEGFTVEATASGSQTNAGTSENVVNDGYVIKNAAGEDKTANFTNVRKVDGTLNVTKAPVTITTGSGKKEYDGTPLTNEEIDIDGLAENESVTLKTTGTVTEVGTDDNTYTIKWDNASESNYEVTEELGTLEVTKNSKEITLTAASDNKVYDGKALTKDEVTPEGLPEGFTIKATATGSQLNVGTSDNVVDEGYQILYKGEDKTENFTNIVPVNGILEVTKAPLTIKTNTKSKKYDGLPLTAGAVVETTEKTNKIDDDHDDQEITVTLINGETATITLANKLTGKGKIDNTYAIAWGETRPDNYELKEEVGTLEVTDRGDDAFVVYASVEDVTRTYNGTEWKNFDYSLTSEKTLLENIVDFFANMFRFISHADMDEETETLITPIDGGATFKITGVKVATAETDAGTYAMTMDFSNVSVIDPEGNEVKDQFRFEEDKMGSLIIERAPLTVTTGSASQTFNNQPLTNPEASLSGLVEGEEATVVATGSQTAVGSSANTYVITWVTAKESNYSIIENLGTLTVNAVPSGPTPPPTGPTPTTPPTADAPAPAPEAAVLGARRGEEATDGRAVLGARRGRTDDETNSTARVFSIVVSAAIAVSLMITGKKKEEEEN